MELSVVVPTLNGREQLRRCLDGIAEHVPDAEVVVVNGPSADGTTGMVRDRDDVDALLELSERNVNVARNAGIRAATGDTVAVVSYDYTVEDSWYDGLTDALADGADVVTGPTHRTLRAGMTTESEERRTIAGREVTYFNADNVAFTREAVEAVDGFDERLSIGGARDCAHRLAGVGRSVEWTSSMCVRGEYGADGGRIERDWQGKYHSLAYRLVKNYGLGPNAVGRTVYHALRDGVGYGVEAVRGDDGATPSEWFENGTAVVRGIVAGTKDGSAARAGDRTPRRNPAGLSARRDRAVERYDWR